MVRLGDQQTNLQDLHIHLKHWKYVSPRPASYVLPRIKLRTSVLGSKPLSTDLPTSLAPKRFSLREMFVLWSSVVFYWQVFAQRSVKSLDCLLALTVPVEKPSVHQLPVASPKGRSFHPVVGYATLSIHRYGFIWIGDFFLLVLKLCVQECSGYEHRQS